MPRTGMFYFFSTRNSFLRWAELQLTRMLSTKNFFEEVFHWICLLRSFFVTMTVLYRQCTAKSVETVFMICVQVCSKSGSAMSPTATAASRPQHLPPLAELFTARSMFATDIGSELATSPPTPRLSTSSKRNSVATDYLASYQRGARRDHVLDDGCPLGSSVPGYLSRGPTIKSVDSSRPTKFYVERTPVDFDHGDAVIGLDQTDREQGGVVVRGSAAATTMTTPSLENPPPPTSSSTVSTEHARHVEFDLPPTEHSPTSPGGCPPSSVAIQVLVDGDKSDGNDLTMESQLEHVRHKSGGSCSSQCSSESVMYGLRQGDVLKRK